MELIKFKDLFAALEKSFTATYKPMENDFPLERILVRLKNSFKDELLLEIMYSKDIESPMEGHSVIQFFVKLPFEPQKDHLPAAMDLLAKLNTGVQLLGFCYNPQRNYLYFKYIANVPDALFEQLIPSLAETCHLVGFTLETYYLLIKEVATGKIESDLEKVSEIAKKVLKKK